MSIEELTSGITIYCVKSNRVVWYRYLCVHPSGKGSYHILIEGFTEEPLRIHKDELQKMLDQGCLTYESVQLLLARKLREESDHLFKKLEEKGNLTLKQ